MSRIVAIVGRPNVGKSTLFNRLTGSRKAIVDDVAGVTRDRHGAKVEWNGQEFTVIDTGGFVEGSEDAMEQSINRQVKAAMEQSDLLLMMVDVQTGITDLDAELADQLRRSKRPVLLVVNKVDHGERLPSAAEFYALGLGEIFCVSSQTGSGTGDLLDEVLSRLPEAKGEDEQPETPRMALVGRPNVGKSTLLNALMGEERSIVSEVAGTTRDVVHSELRAFGHHFLMMDTAGLRRKAKVEEDIEFYSVMRTLRTIEDCDVVVLLIDAREGLQSQDLNIFHLAQKHQKGIILAVNKWDLVEKDHKTMENYRKDLLQKTAPFTDLPVLFISALEKQRLIKLLEEMAAVAIRRSTKVTTAPLNEYLQGVIEAYPPPAYKGKYIRIKYITQLKTLTPTFVFFCNLPQYIRDPYKRYLEGKIRAQYDFSGVPMQLYFRQK
ncbi:MAG: ribosome biogenesis GTPase Der [Bacteroidota bacterium]